MHHLYCEPFQGVTGRYPALVVSLGQVEAVTLALTFIALEVL